MAHLITMLLLTVGLMLLAFAALHDFAFRTVPNGVSATLLLVGVLLRARHGDLVVGGLCSLSMFTVTYMFWRFGWIGGADAKLLSASAIFVPPDLLPTMIISVSLSGGALAVLYLLGGHFAPHQAIRPEPKAGILTRIKLCELRRLRRRGPIPYAAAIAAGGWLTMTGA